MMEEMFFLFFYLIPSLVALDGDDGAGVVSSLLLHSITCIA